MTTQAETNNVNTMIDAINENAGYEYITDRALEADRAITTQDTIEDFMNAQEHYETRNTSKGTIEVFIKNSMEIQVMDFGGYRLVMED